MGKTIREDQQKKLAMAYSTGFILSLLLTIIPYLLGVNKRLAGNVLVVALMAFALVQLAIQLIFFLHLGAEKKPRWNQMVFAFMALIVLIVVGGSLWIMNNLNYHMDPREVEQYIKQEELIDRP